MSVPLAEAAAITAHLTRQATSGNGMTLMASLVHNVALWVACGTVRLSTSGLIHAGSRVSGISETTLASVSLSSTQHHHQVVATLVLLRQGTQRVLRLRKSQPFKINFLQKTGSSFRLVMHSAFQLSTRKSCTSSEKTLLQIVLQLMLRRLHGNLSLTPRLHHSNRSALLNCSEIRLVFFMPTTSLLQQTGSICHSTASQAGQLLRLTRSTESINLSGRMRALARLCRGSWIHPGVEYPP